MDGISYFAVVAFHLTAVLVGKIEDKFQIIYMLFIQDVSYDVTFLSY